MNKAYFYLILILLIGLFLRIISLYPANTIIGFDQARDLNASTVIFKDLDLKIIGPTAGNNAGLHHGVLYYYYILPPLILFGGNPIFVAIWNSLFNLGAALVLYFLSLKMFKNLTAALITAFIAAVSFQNIQFAGWLSNPTFTLFSVPLFFLSIWTFYKGKDWGLPVASLALGLSIQFELFFIYLIPIMIITWFLLKIKLPGFKLALISLTIFALTTLTMILTEIKYNFAGVISILNAGTKVGGSNQNFFAILEKFTDRFGQAFALNLLPQRLDLGLLISVIIVSVVVVNLAKKFSNREARDSKLFLLIYLFSPAIMLILGYHDAPWFLIGLPPAIALISGYVLSKLHYFVLIPIIIFIFWSNTTAIYQSLGQGQILLSPDPSALLSDQLQAIDYTYQKSAQDKFTINTLTNPLYINATWSYHYNWYGKQKYGTLPTWSGGDQIYPYNMLSKSTGQEKYLFIIIDQSFRIPGVYKQSLIGWANQNSKLIEEQTFGGLLVQMRQLQLK